MRNESKGWKSVLLTVFLVVLAIFFLAPIFLVLMNSFKASFIFLMRPLRCRIPRLLWVFAITGMGLRR